MLDVDTVDVCFAPKTDHHHKRIRMQVYLRCHLHHYPIDCEIRAMDEFGVGFGRVIRGAVLGPNLVIDRLFGLLNMQFAKVSMRILSTEIIDAVRDVGGLLYLNEEITSTDGMQPSGREEIEVTLVRFVSSDDIQKGIGDW